MWSYSSSLWAYHRNAAGHAEEDEAGAVEASPSLGLPRRARVRLGLLFLAVALAAFVVQSEVVQYVQGQNNFYKPWFVLYVAHGAYAVFLPVQLIEAVCLRKQSAAEHLRSISRRAKSLIFPDSTGIDTGAGHMNMALAPAYGWLLARTACLTVLFTCGSLSWYISVTKIPMSDVTAIYNTSCFFTYALSTMIAGEAVKMRKAVAVLLSVGGIGLIALFGDSPRPSAFGSARGSWPKDSDIFRPAPVARKDDASETAAAVVGYAAATAASLFIALYEVLYSKLLVPSPPSARFSLHVTGLIGVTTIVLGLPLFPLLHATGLETFEWPDAASWAYIAANAVLGIAFNALFMLVMAFAGPVLAAVGILTTIPLMAVVDYFVTGHPIGLGTAAGSLVILCGFAILHSETAG
ncbi:hypothetical protein HK105_200674 [Polyrhizophydium stewartii]|uniref:EamA domain-containing protein n=1 Tax=Polyrhizophydium stewartii TaxID=2732419 RepID=A0ABR4NJP8_9FUNG